MTPGYRVLRNSIGCRRSNSLGFLLSLETLWSNSTWGWVRFVLHYKVSKCLAMQGGLTVCAPPSENMWGSETHFILSADSNTTQWKGIQLLDRFTSKTKSLLSLWYSRLRFETGWAKFTLYHIKLSPSKQRVCLPLKRETVLYLMCFWCIFVSNQKHNSSSLRRQPKTQEETELHRETVMKCVRKSNWNGTFSFKRVTPVWDNRVKVVLHHKHTVGEASKLLTVANN